VRAGMDRGTNGYPTAAATETGTVGVVIPVYRAGPELLDAIASVLGGTLAPAWIILVDNASGLDEVDRAAAAFPAIEVVRNDENLGFGQACNQGIGRLRERGAEFVLLLNQDATLAPDALASLVALAEARPRAAAIGPKTLSSVTVDGAVPVVLYDGAFRTAFPLWQRLPGIGQPDRAGDDRPLRVDFVWGHAMLLRVAALAEVGDFDPAFFMYCEDLDLCDRVRRAGWEVWCDRRAIARHAIDDPSRASKSELRRWRWKQASGRHFCRARWRWPLADAIWLASTCRELANLCRRGHGRAAGHLVRATWEVGWGRLGRGDAGRGA